MSLDLSPVPWVASPWRSYDWTMGEDTEMGNGPTPPSAGADTAVGMCVHEPNKAREHRVHAELRGEAP